MLTASFLVDSTFYFMSSFYFNSLELFWTCDTFDSFLGSTLLLLSNFSVLDTFWFLITSFWSTFLVCYCFTCCCGVCLSKSSEDIYFLLVSLFIVLGGGSFGSLEMVSTAATKLLAFYLYSKSSISSLSNSSASPIGFNFNYFLI